VRSIPIDQIVVPGVRARSRLSEEQKAFLKGSISKYGFLSPIIVRPLADGRFELIDGESRMNEAKEAGKAEVDALVIQFDDRDASIVNLLMNVARGEQDPMGSATAIKKALDAGMSIEEVAKATRHTPQWVKFMLLLLDLPGVYQEALEDGKLKVTHIREALRLPSPQEMDVALSSAITHGWTTGIMHHYVNERLREYKVAEERSRLEGVSVPPPPPEPQRLIRYTQCLVCGQMVPKEMVTLPTVCSECYELAKYVTSQLGTGDKAMRMIYEALQTHMAWLQYREQHFKVREMAESRFRREEPSGGEGVPPQEQAETGPPIPEQPVIGEKELRREFRRLYRKKPPIR